ncbi:alpha-hydroxy-acid oxidizing protein [Nonomuraea sp. NPDC050536]|uniref:alpha-hydroxy-acid oxidizing protein n=1 Tax=Nonomuraea sp. NPDC050536 TaxID=3364366 RepID=UPI0037C8BD43
MGFTDFQRDIYGDAGAPPYSVNLPALEEAARAVMSVEAFQYLAGSAGDEATARANRASFDSWRIVPRMLTGPDDPPSLSVELFGQTYPAPVALAPVAAQTIMHPDGELASALAAASVGLPFVLSSFASHSLESIASVGGPRWFQLYWPFDDELTASLLSRAASSGFSALVVTLDAWVVGFRPRELDLGYNPFLKGIGLATPLSDPVFMGRTAGLSDPDAGKMWASLVQGRAHSWSELEFLRAHWPGPILLKGILHPDDARRAVDHGMDGIIVSNHGGRQLDGAVSSLQALPEVARAVGSQCTVALDSGLRTGADVLKALALGAHFVLLGRPYLWGLALGGEPGVRHVLRSLLADLEVSLALSGRTLSTLAPSDLVRGDGTLW